MERFAPLRRFPLSDVILSFVETVPPGGSWKKIRTDIPSDLQQAFGEPSVFSTLLSLLNRVIQDIGRSGEPVTLEVRSLPSGVRVAFRASPSAAAHHVFQNSPPQSERSLRPGTIDRLNDTLAAYLLAQKLAVQYGMKTWVDLEPQEARVHLYLHDYPSMATVERERPLVLVIEDVPAIGKLLEFYLRNAGFDTMLALNGEAGIEAAFEHVPDLITLDVWMPNMDGLAVLNVLKATGRTRPIPVVLVTVLPNRLVGYERGASDYLQKPVMREDIIECAWRLTRPTFPPPRILTPPLRSILVIRDSEQPAFSPAGAGEDTVVRSVPFDQPQFMTTVTAVEQPPDLIVVDAFDDADLGLRTVHRLRLLERFDAVPLVALCPPSSLSLLSSEAGGLIDGVLPPGVPTIEQYADATRRGAIAT
ncbi:MAG: response regulator [Bacteroidota bacterium]|nr:response regulator [Bacteroidota bacterium]